MNPDDFLALAAKLFAAGGEAELRTAVSRAYYGAFHQAHLLVSACGVVLSRDASAHKHVAYCLQHSDDADLIAAGRKLDSLRAERNAADYRLDDRGFRDRNFVQLCLARAEQISHAISKSRRQLNPIRAAIRQHAKQILKLPVRGKD